MRSNGDLATQALLAEMNANRQVAICVAGPTTSVFDYHAALGLKREVLALLEEDQPRIAQVIKYQEQQLTALAL